MFQEYKWTKILTTLKKRQNSLKLVIFVYMMTDWVLDSRGLMCILLSYPDSWKFYNINVAKICDIGIDKLNKLYRQLEKFGYLKRTKKRWQRENLGVFWIWNLRWRNLKYGNFIRIPQR